MGIILNCFIFISRWVISTCHILSLRNCRGQFTGRFICLPPTCLELPRSFTCLKGLQVSYRATIWSPYNGSYFADDIWQWVTIGLSHGLTPTWRQVIIQADVDLNFCRNMASLGNIWNPTGFLFSKVWIFVFHLTVIIKSEIGIINHRLVPGQETMVFAAISNVYALSVFPSRVRCEKDPLLNKRYTSFGSRRSLEMLV